MSNDFPSRLIELRGNKNMTQQELGDAAGVSPSQISRYEAGSAMPRKTVLTKLAAALDVTPQDLLAKNADTAMESKLSDGSRRLQQQFVDALDRIPSDVQQQYEDAAKEAGMPIADYMLKLVEKRFIETAVKMAEDGDKRGANEMRVITVAIFNRSFDLPTDD